MSNLPVEPTQAAADQQFENAMEAVLEELAGVNALLANR